MSVGTILKVFLPHNLLFHTLFEEIINNIKAMSEMLVMALEANEPETCNALLHTMSARELKSKECTQDMLRALAQHFVTPFERGDIHELTTALDDIASGISGSAKYLLNYRLGKADATMKEFSVIIDKSVDALHICIHNLRHIKYAGLIKDCCGTINKLENDADDLFNSAMVALFSSSVIDTLEIIKLKDLYQEMEAVTDKCEDAAATIESIAIKYS